MFLKWFFFWKNLVDFRHRKLTLKVQFWHFLMNHNSWTDLKKRSFEFIDSWPKILLFRTHHLWNSTTKLILLSLHGRVNGSAKIWEGHGSSAPPPAPNSDSPGYFLWLWDRIWKISLWDIFIIQLRLLHHELIFKLFAFPWFQFNRVWIKKLQIQFGGHAIILRKEFQNSLQAAKDGPLHSIYIRTVIS